MASKYKRGKIWWGKVQHKGRVHRQSLETTRGNVADKRLKEWVQRLKDQSWGDEPRRSFNEMAESFVLKHMPNLLPTSQRRYRASLRNLIPHFENLYWDEITSSKLAEFEAYRKRDSVTHSTIIRDLRCLSSIITHAQVDLEWAGTNTVTLFLKRQGRRGRLKESPARTRYLSHAEEAKLLNAAKGDLEDQISFAIDTGLRLEEQLSLTWAQVSYERKEVTVTGKGNKTRTVPLLPRAIKTLQRQVRRLRFDGGTDYVFCHPTTGKRYGKRTRGLAKAVKDAKIKHIQWHDLRRTCGCRLLQDHELSKEKVQLWLGHSSIKTTESTYAFLEVENLHEAVASEIPGAKT